MSGEEELPEDKITKRLPDSAETPQPSEPPTVKLNMENSNTEVELLQLRLQDEEAQRRRAEDRARQLETEKSKIIDELVEAKYKTGELLNDLLDEIEEQILITIGERDGSCNEHELRDRLRYNLYTKGKREVNQVILDRCLSKLKEKGHITSNDDSRSVYEEVTYSLTDKGRDYLIDNKLL